MSKEMLKNLIELVPDADIDTIYKVVVEVYSRGETASGRIESDSGSKG